MAIVTLMFGVVFSVLYVSTKRELETQSMNIMQSYADEHGQMRAPEKKDRPVRLPCFSIETNKLGEITGISGSIDENFNMDYARQLLACTENSEPFGKLGEYELRYCKRVTPFGELTVFADISAENTALNSLIRTSLLVGLAAFIIFLCISILLARWSVSPIEKAWKRQKEFVADASHELKTPLTVITTNAELLNSEEYDAQEKKQFSENILSVSGQMQILIKKMLELARFDSGYIKEKTEKTAFDEICSEAIMLFEPVFFENGRSVEAEIEENICIQGNREHLKQLVEIFLDNACKYSEKGSMTVVVLKSISKSKCRLEVSSPGEAMDKDELENIFKRFYRSNKARTSDGSYGLGLSIASEIVREHHGKIWAQSHDGKNSFFVELTK